MLLKSQDLYDQINEETLNLVKEVDQQLSELKTMEEKEIEAIQEDLDYMDFVRMKHLVEAKY